MKLSKKHSFFSRLMLVSTISFMLLALCTSTLIASLSRRFERAQYLKSYDMAINSLSQAYAYRCESLFALAGQLVVDGYCNSDLCTLLTAESYHDVSASSRTQISKLFNSMLRSSTYLNGFLMYSISQNRYYYYAPESSTLIPSKTDLPVPGFVPFQFQKCSQEDIDNLISSIREEPTSGAYDNYGFVTTIYQSPAKPLGYLILPFSSQEFDRLLTGFNVSPDAAFTITDSDGRIYYQSNPDFHESKGQISASLTNKAYDFQVSYRVDPYHPSLTHTTTLSIILAALLSLFSLGFYFRFYRLSERKVNRILESMEHIGIDNLSYRIAKPETSDEFTQIIEGLNQMCDSLEENIQRSYIFELQQKKSELYALQASISPHFLYNTLEIIRQKVLTGHVQGAEQMILLLSRIYRSQNSRRFFSTIRDEAENCENLMCLYQYRFQNFDYYIETEDEAARYAVPQHTMQPMIENYFVHGIDPAREDNTVEVLTSLERTENGPFIHLSVRNNGKSISQEELNRLNSLLAADIYANKENHGFALTNINSRMKILYQDNYHMTISTPSMEGFCVELVFPARSISELEAFTDLPDE